MNPKFHLLNFGTFGSPNGYNHSLSFGERESMRFLRTFDLNTTAIKLFPGSKLISIKKGNSNESRVLIFSIYTHALEPNSNRGGTFIGTGLICENSYPEIPVLIPNLLLFNKLLFEQNVSNDRLLVNHSDSLTIPKTKIKSNLENSLKKRVPSFPSVKYDQSLLIQTVSGNQLDPNIIAELIPLLEKYNEIFVTDNSEISGYAKQKGLYNVIFLSHDKKGIQIELEKLEKEKEENNKRLYDKLDSAKNENLSKIKKKIEIVSNDLKNIEEYNNKLLGIRNKIQSEFNVAITNFRDRKWTNYETQENIQNSLGKINSELSKIEIDYNYKSRGTTKNNISPINEREQKQYENTFHIDNYSFGSDIYFISTVCLLVLLIGSWMYFFLSAPDENSEIQPNEQVKIGFLKDSDVKRVNRAIKYNTTIDSITEVIFQLNPNDVEEHFSNHVKEFQQNLIAQNPLCFNKNAKGIFIYSKDSLTIIPATY